MSAAQAGSELLGRARWEEHAAWLLAHTNRCPKSQRFTLVQRLQVHALDVLELLVQARYQPSERHGLLERVNLTLERMRLLLRLAVRLRVTGGKGYERAASALDETGRMVHGWRAAIGART